MDNPTSKVTVEREGIVIVLEQKEAVLEDILMAFEDALRGCGFRFDGELEIVENDSDCCKG